MKIGYFLSSEEWRPQDLVQQALKAQESGFEGLWISDHFHPWNDKQGHSPFVWATIGAIAQVTEGVKVTTAVTCPTIRTHPAVVAHAAATCAVMLRGNFALGRADDEAQARKTVHELRSNEGLPGELAQILPTPEHFEPAGELITEDLATASAPCGPDVDRHLEAVNAYEAAGFDELNVNQIGPDQDAFFEAYRDKVLPSL